MFKEPGNRFREIDSAIAYEAWRAGTTNKVVVPALQARNRFRGSLKGLQIRAPDFSQRRKPIENDKDMFKCRRLSLDVKKSGCSCWKALLTSWLKYPQAQVVKPLVSLMGQG